MSSSALRHCIGTLSIKYLHNFSYTLMNECWSHVPKERPKFSKIIETFALAEQEDLTALPTNDNDRFYFVLESV